MRWALAAGMLLSTGLVSAADAAEPFRSAADAPASWGLFARHLKIACEKQLQAATPLGNRFNAALQKLTASQKADEPPLPVRVSLWITAKGTIDRTSATPLPSADMTADLQSLLAKVSVEAPPPDLLQPVRLSLALKARK